MYAIRSYYAGVVLIVVSAAIVSVVAPPIAVIIVTTHSRIDHADFHPVARVNASDGHVCRIPSLASAFGGRNLDRATGRRLDPDVPRDVLDGQLFARVV